MRGEKKSRSCNGTKKKECSGTETVLRVTLFAWGGEKSKKGAYQSKRESLRLTRKRCSFLPGENRQKKDFIAGGQRAEQFVNHRGNQWRNTEGV